MKKVLHGYIKVQCTHSEPGIQKNVDCELIEYLDAEPGAVFRCPACKREIVVCWKIEQQLWRR